MFKLDTAKNKNCHKIHQNKVIVMQSIIVSIALLAFGWILLIDYNHVASAADDQLKPLNKTQQSCNPYQVNNDKKRIVCVCNSRTPCGKLEFNWPETTGETFLVRSTEAGLRFDVSDLKPLEKPLANLGRTRIDIDLKIEHQPILGFGGAFTDATGINLANLSVDLANTLLESYFTSDGLQYNIGRVPVSGTDFSARAYTYDDSPEPDYELKNWALTQEDAKYKIPYIKEAQKMVSKWGPDLKLFSSSWSPPKWMKTNNNLVRGSLIDEDRVYKSYAEYLIKFYEAYEKQGIKFWGGTVQNEPVASNLPGYAFNSLQMGNEQMVKFVGKYLGPMLVKHGKTRENFKLMVGDDSLGLINVQVPEVMADPDVQKYVAGLAFHWYTSGLLPFDLLDRVYDAIKDKIEFVLMTEACTGSMPLQKKVDFGSWNRGQSYFSDITENLLRHTGGWVDWNMALNMEGGPNWADNLVDSAILVNSRRGEFYKQPMYYAIAHFSKFYKPGSIRVDSKVKSDRNFWELENVAATAVHNKATGHLIINILNKGSSGRRIDLALHSLEKNSIQGDKKSFRIDPKSFNTLVVKL